VAYAYRLNREESKASAELNEVLKIEPKDGFDGFKVRGYVFEQKSDFSRAIVDYTRWAAIEPESALPYAARANARQKNHENDAAIADATRSIEIDPTFGRAYRIRGLARVEKSEYIGAIADYTSAIQTDPRLPANYRLRAKAYELAGKFDEAIADLSKLIELNDRDVDAYRRRRSVYLLKHDNAAALADDEKARELTWQSIGVGPYKTSPLNGPLLRIIQQQKPWLYRPCYTVGSGPNGLLPTVCASPHTK
jgi:tetratricopeptide (TPR) repeat protein